MSRITLLDNDFQDKYWNFLTSVYKRNKSLLIISTVIFFLSILIGCILSGAIDQFMISVLNSLKGKFSEEGLTTISIFKNNFQSAFLTYAGGVIGIITGIVLFFNGLIIGYVVTKYPISIIYIVPHGIFEIPALILSGAAGFRITSMIIHVLISLSKGTPINERYWELKDSLILFVIAVILLIIAAFIEANITLSLGKYIQGLI